MKLRFLPIFFLSLLCVMCCVAAADMYIFWNSTGTYIQVRNLQEVPQVSTYVTALYNLTGYHRITRDFLKIGPTQCILVNQTGIYVINGTSTSCVLVYPGICTVLNNRTWICQPSTRTVPLNVTISPGTYNVTAHYDMCILVLYGNITREHYVLNIQLYNYYTQGLIWSVTTDHPGHVQICGVPDRVLLNITKNGEWLGLFLVSTQVPAVTLPPKYSWLALLIPVAVFGLFAVREGSRDIGIGMIAAGAMLLAAGPVFGLVSNPYLYAAGILLIIFGGIIYMLSQTKS